MADNSQNREAWKSAVSATDDCLSVEQLERCAEGNAPLDAHVRRHLEKCPHCQTELAMLKNFEAATPVPGEGAAPFWITTRLERDLAKPAPHSPVAVPAPFWRSLFRLPYVVAGMAVAVIAIFGVSLYIFQRSKEPLLSAGVYRPDLTRSGSVQLVGPSGDLKKPPAEFRWQPYNGAAAYSVELQEVDGNPVWTGNAEQPFVAVTPAMKKIMRPGKTLQWKVTALEASGKAVAKSSLASFRVVRPDQ